MYKHPQIIQGGMGIGVSGWQLARAVSLSGQLGVVSGTCIDTIMVRRLQDGDPGGHMRRAIREFPLPEIADYVLKKYYLENGRKPGHSYKLLPLLQKVSTCIRQQIMMLASFAEVYLAKENHSGAVGMNLLTKIQLPNLATIYGAMLAGVDYLLMGAGIPREIPEALERLRNHEVCTIKLEAEGMALKEHTEISFNPTDHFPENVPKLRKPFFFPIISTHSLAQILAKKSNGAIDGFIVESHLAGGHNAPPRRSDNNQNKELVYTEKDNANLQAIKELGIPFWLAGSQGKKDSLKNAQNSGAAGIQVGTLFAFARESDLKKELKDTALQQALKSEIKITTDKLASPTRFPFKIVDMPGTLSNPELNSKRQRLCDLGYLRTAYVKEDGTTVFRCPGEPVDDYVRKGGNAEDTVGKICLCNSLFSAVGLGQTRKNGYQELPLLTSGEQLKELSGFIKRYGSDYKVKDVLNHLLTQP